MSARRFEWLTSFPAHARLVRGNPVAEWLMRASTTPGQWALLLVVPLMIAAITGLFKTRLGVPSDLLDWPLFRLLSSEFVALWMATDHIGDMLTRVRRRGISGDWRLTALTDEDVVDGMVQPTWRHLAWIALIWLGIDAAVPDVTRPPGLASGWGSGRWEVWGWTVLWSLLLTGNFLAMARLAAARAMAEAFPPSGMGTFWRRVVTYCLLAGFVSFAIPMGVHLLLVFVAREWGLLDGLHRAAVFGCEAVMMVALYGAWSIRFKSLLYLKQRQRALLAQAAWRCED